jgi:DNA-binding CsgD family transcriptional regulator
VRVLTPRQLEILRLVANGNTAAQTATRLRITPDTVNSALRRIYRALGTSGRAHTVAVALRVGVLTDADVTVPEALRARLGPAGTPEAPDPRRTAARRSSNDGAAFNGPPGLSSAARSADSPASEAEKALSGP